MMQITRGVSEHQKQLSMRSYSFLVKTSLIHFFCVDFFVIMIFIHFSQACTVLSFCSRRELS